MMGTVAEEAGGSDLLSNAIVLTVVAEVLGVPLGSDVPGVSGVGGGGNAR